jgi:hypothetical protein
MKPVMLAKRMESNMDREIVIYIMLPHGMVITVCLTEGANMADLSVIA